MEVEYSVRIEPEDIQFEGNACAHDGDDECYAWIRSELESGNMAAWCWVEVTARLEVDGHVFKGSAGVGGCSYRSEDEIHKEVVPDLKPEALEDLHGELQRATGMGLVAATILREFVK